MEEPWSSDRGLQETGGVGLDTRTEKQGWFGDRPSDADSTEASLGSSAVLDLMGERASIIETSISDFWYLELQDMHFCCFKQFTS